MSQEKVLKTLMSLGLSRLDAEVYVFLARRGPIKAREVTKTLKISKQRLYPIIKNLRAKGIVNSTLEHPARFSSMPFENVLDLFALAKMEEAEHTRQTKEEILADWQSIDRVESETSPSKFTVIDGRSYVYSKIQQMIQETKSHLSFVATVPSLARADQYGLFDAAFSHPLKTKICFRFLTEISDKNTNALKALLKKTPRGMLKLEGRTPNLGLKLCPRMVIRDDEETVFFIDEKSGEFATEQDDVCLWTNSKSLVNAFLAMFEDLWRNSTDVDKKIIEIETETPAPRTCIIGDAEAAKKKRDETLNEAVKEIIIMTSPAGLTEFWRNKHLVKHWAERDVSVRIMAPITGENLKAAQQLQKSCEVRHVAAGYLGTAIVDGQHLFQFKNPPIDQTNPKNTAYYENTFYTNDFDYVEKTKKMLDDIWEKARAPSAVTMESITRQAAAGAPPKVHRLDIRKTIGEMKYLTFIGDAKASKTLTEKQVLHKAVSADKIPAKDLSKEFSRMFSTWAWAVIESPKMFNLPKMMVYAIHIEKQSSLGEEDTVHIYLWLNTPTGYGFVPVAIIHDRPEVAPHWKESFAGTPAEQNIQTVKKDEIQVRVHGNTLFAGWTVPIKLWPPPYSLPPSCILFEGYGNAKPGRTTVITLSGETNKMEYNSVEAFVTFMHPASKYEGPATEGILLRDCIVDTYPP